MNDESREAFSRGSAIRRAGRAGFLRNVAVALGNWGSAAAVPVLSSALHDPEPLVRGHAAWSLGRIGSRDGLDALEAALWREEEPWVRGEMARALDLEGPTRATPA